MNDNEKFTWIAAMQIFNSILLIMIFLKIL